jgi:hypothetical protein
MDEGGREIEVEVDQKEGWGAVAAVKLGRRQEGFPPFQPQNPRF